MISRISTLLLLVLFPFYLSSSNLVKKGNRVTNNSIVLEVFQEQSSYTIQGKVIDATTGNIIPYCGIKVLNSTVGTASNELGEFELKVSSFPVELYFSHINYEDFQTTISSSADILEIRLRPLVNLLETVVVATPKLKNDPNASKLATRIYRKVSSRLNKELKYSKAFYRQKTKTDQRYTEFAEILFDVEYNSGGVLKWDILEGRYALNEDGINNKNYTRLSQILKGFQPQTEDLIFPLHPELEEHYYVNIKETFKSNNDEIVILRFTPRNPLEIPTFRGEAYINKTTDELLKISCSIVNDKLDLVSLTEKKAKKANYRLAFEMVFKDDESIGEVLDYIKVDQEFDYYKGDEFYSHVTSTSNLTFIEHYESTNKKKLGRQFRRGNSDWENLDEIGYNRAYWENNPIVKRTPIEADVIDAFEKENAFESIFLNSKDEITVIQSRISQDSLIQRIDGLLGIYNANQPIEKVYLHTDKNVVGLGDNLWYSAYVVMGPMHNYSSASKMLKVELINDQNELVLSQKKKIYDGTSLGHFTVPKEFTSGNYELRAYTDWMERSNPNYIFRKTIKIENPLLPNEQLEESSANLDIQFLPEGGYAIAGLRNRIAFKVCDDNGKSHAISGQIVDSQGNFVTRIQANEGGMGTFTILPVIGEKYKARLDSNQEYELPEILGSGYNMFVNNLNPNTIQVRIQATNQLRDKDIYLIGSVRNYKFFQGKYNLRNQPFIDIEIPKNRFPSGIVSIAMIDSNMKPWCERIVFINHKNELKIETNIKKSASKDSVQLNVTVKDFNGQPVATNLSLAITNTNRTHKNISDSNILSYLLLESNLKGAINSPMMFLTNDSRRVLYGLDMLMLTNGWRKFKWIEQQDSPASVNNFTFNESYNVSGVARGKDDEVLDKKALDLIVKMKDELVMYSTETGSQGEFLFTNLNHTGTTELTFNAYNENRKPLDLQVTLNKESSLTLDAMCISKINNTAQEPEYAIEELEQEYLNNVIEEFNSDFNGITALDEVVVEGRRREREKLTPSFMGVEGDDVIFVEEDDVSIMEVLNRGTGVFITGDPHRPKVRVQGIGDVTWVVDGVTIAANDDPREDNSTATSSSPTLNAMIQPNPAPIEIATLDMNTIERVEILKGSKTSILGARGSSAAIIIYTKAGKYYESKTVNSPKVIAEGFSAERAFYIPKYFKVGNTNISSTAYWNGSILTDENGKAAITIPRNDGAVQIAIEALSFNGVAGYYLETIKK